MAPFACFQLPVPPSMPQSRKSAANFSSSRRSFSMHKVRLLVLCSSVLLMASACVAQTATGETLMLNPPRARQHATVMQRIGIADITGNYHRPLANRREIWGKVVPYGKVWRAGANENTTITFSDPVMIEGQPLDKGTYGVHMIRGENKGPGIFPKEARQGGGF